MSKTKVAGPSRTARRTRGKGVKPFVVKVGTASTSSDSPSPDPDFVRDRMAKLEAFFEEITRLVPPTTPILSEEALRRRSLYGSE
jgi:hypothetical protein